MQMNLAYGPLDVVYIPNDPSKVMTFAAMVNIGGNAFSQIFAVLI